MIQPVSAEAVGAEASRYDQVGLPVLLLNSVQNQVVYLQGETALMPGMLRGGSRRRRRSEQEMTDREN